MDKDDICLTFFVFMILANCFKHLLQFPNRIPVSASTQMLCVTNNMSGVLTLILALF